MIVHRIEAAAFGTNCYLVARAAGEKCVIVDPGIGVADRVAALLGSEGLRPVAVLLTHGHLDHVYDVPDLSERFAPSSAPDATLPSYIHTSDRYRLANPLGDLDASFLAMMEAQFGQRAQWTQPGDIVEIDVGTTGAGSGQGGTDSVSLSVAGLHLRVHHAPGHTEGSVLFALADVPEGLSVERTLESTVLSGDVLFAGSIGRCDLPGGDASAMTRSLRDVVLPLPDATLVLPGHGPSTSMAVERTNNPFLRSLLV
ncbi:MAG: MBL fold metallo-hydrolase [Ornithinimicrobium sp.]